LRKRGIQEVPRYVEKFIWLGRDVSRKRDMMIEMNNR
jgi:hypothetical protein